MNDFNVLLNAATNGTPSGSLFDALFARYIAPQESWRELESPLPITILAAGEDLIDYRIYGNTENGESVGERMANLFDANGTENYGYYAAGSGQYVDNKNYKHWRFPVKEGDIVRWTYYGAGTGCLFYKGNYVTHFYSNASPLTIPSGVDEITNNYISRAVPSAMVTLNQPLPTSYIPYGYKLPMVVRSRNLFDGQGTDNYGYYNNDNGLYVNSRNYKYWRFPVEEGDIIRWTTTGAGYGCYFSNGVYKGRFTTYSTPLTVPKDVDEITNNFVNTSWDSAIVTLNQPLPDQYIPYYRDEENIYIGSDPLAEDEYVDFGEQKIYRMANGTLTPTDPPVPIPALPTIQGETIIDYNPSTTPAVEPEKMYIKYKPQ